MKSISSFNSLTLVFHFFSSGHASFLLFPLPSFFPLSALPSSSSPHRLHSTGLGVGIPVFFADMFRHLDLLLFANLFWLNVADIDLVTFLFHRGHHRAHLLLLRLTLVVGVAMVVVEETVRTSPPAMVQRLAHFDLLAVALLVASDHLVLMGLRLANPLWLQVAELLRHFLKLELADRRWRQVVELHVVANVPMEVKRAVPQPTVCHTCQDKYPEHGCLEASPCPQL